MPSERPPPGDTGSAALRDRLGPTLALAAVAVGAFVLFSALALSIPAPRVLSDELRYTIAAASLLEGEGLRLRGEEYGFGPLYPAVLAAILAVTPDRESAYPLFKLANALLFALTTIPVYLLARRLLSAWWSVSVAALSVAIPASMYVSLVMTESVSYFAASWALLALILAFEYPTALRQLAAVGAIGVAVAARPQFAVLAGVLLAGLVLRWLLAPVPRPRLVRELAPSLAVVGLALAAFLVRPLATGTSYSDALGAYGDLWGGYDVGAVARWIVYHLAALELEVAVVPLAVAPIVLVQLAREGRAGASRSAAFLALFVTVNASLLLVAAAFSSTEHGLDRLHGRYVFYVLPLWFVVLAKWLADGLPRPLLALALGVCAALALPAAIPFARVTDEEGGAEVDSLVSHLWTAVDEAALALAPDHLAGRRVLALFVVALLVAVVLVPRRYGLALGGAVAGVLVVWTGLTWANARNAATDADVVLGPDAAWIAAALPSGREVTALYVPPCGPSQQAAVGLLLTEFFNPEVERAAHVLSPDGSLLPSIETRVARDGSVRLESGATLEAEYLVTPPGVTVTGEIVATGTRVPLTLWRVNGPVETVGGDRIRAIQSSRCS
jgi:hypothetical protein